MKQQAWKLAPQNRTWRQASQLADVKQQAWKLAPRPGTPRMRVFETPFDVSIASVAVSSSGRWLATHSHYGRNDSIKPILVWDLLDPDSRPREVKGWRTTSLAFSPCERFLVGSDALHSGILLFPFPQLSHPERIYPEYPFRGFVFVPNSSDMICLRPAIAFRWNLTERKGAPQRLDFLPQFGIFSKPAIHPQGTLLAMGTPDNGTSSLACNVVRVWNIRDGQEVHYLETGPLFISQLAFSPNGNILAGLLADSFMIWDLTNGERVIQVKPKQFIYPPGDHHLSAFALSFTPNGRFLAVGLYDGTVRFYDTTNWSEHQVFDWSKTEPRLRVWPEDLGRPVRSITFTPDGMVAIAAYSFHVIAWDLDE